MRLRLPHAFVTAPLAHRGYHDRARGCIENSASAFRAALAAGYGIELDVHLSRDGQAMVFHDATLDRLTAESGLVNARSAADLGRMRLNGSTDTISTLAQVLKLVAGHAPVLIEIKDQTGAMRATDGRLEQATAAALVGYHGPVAVMSFNPHCIAEMARLAPQVPRGLTTSSYDATEWQPLPAASCDRLRAIPDYDATLCSFISHQASDLARPRVAELKSHGASILCWTIRNPDQESQARQLADNITFESYSAPLSSV